MIYQITPFVLYLLIFKFFSIVFYILWFLVPFYVFEYVLFPLFCTSRIIIFLKNYVFNTTIVTNYNFEIIFDCLFFARSFHSTLPPPFVVIKYPFSFLSTHIWDFIFLLMYFVNSKKSVIAWFYIHSCLLMLMLLLLN